jgi:hypothetical protein
MRVVRVQHLSYRDATNDWYELLLGRLKQFDGILQPVVKQDLRASGPLHDFVAQCQTLQRLPSRWLVSMWFIELSLLGAYAPKSFVWMKLPCQVWYQT